MFPIKKPGSIRQTRLRLSALRWITCLPLAFIGYVVGFLTAVLIHEIGEWTCPAEYWISGTCMAPWSGMVHSTALIVGASIAAILTVLIPTLAAPERKHLVSFTALLLGSSYAGYFMWQVGASSYISMSTAIAVGSLTFLFIRSKLRHSLE